MAGRLISPVRKATRVPVQSLSIWPGCRGFRESAEIPGFASRTTRPAGASTAWAPWRSCGGRAVAAGLSASYLFSHRPARKVAWHQCFSELRCRTRHKNEKEKAGILRIGSLKSQAKRLKRQNKTNSVQTLSARCGSPMYRVQWSRAPCATPMYAVQRDGARCGRPLYTVQPFGARCAMPMYRCLGRFCRSNGPIPALGAFEKPDPPLPLADST